MTLTLSVVLNLTSCLLPAQPNITYTTWSVSHIVDLVTDDWLVSVRVDTGLPMTQLIPTVYDNLIQIIETNPYPGLVVLRPRFVCVVGSSNPGSTWGRGQIHFVFGLRTIQLTGSRIWNNLHPLEIENPILPTDNIRLLSILEGTLLSHPIFGYSIHSPLVIRSIELELTAAPVCVHLLVTRPDDPSCDIPLPRQLADYDLNTYIRVSGFKRVTLVYHVSEKDLITFWLFEFTVEQPLQ